jgi:hypothetical protein
MHNTIGSRKESREKSNGSRGTSPGTGTNRPRSNRRELLKPALLLGMDKKGFNKNDANHRLYEQNISSGGHGRYR